MRKQIYIDCDGVLADFDKGAEKVLGMPPKVFEIPAPPASSCNREFAVIHIGTARDEKFWPAARWAEVIAHLIRERRLSVVLTGTNAGLERPHLDELRGRLAAAGVRPFCCVHFHPAKSQSVCCRKKACRAASR